MPKKQIKKRLIAPKVRLLLWIYLYGVKDESNWRSKLAKKMDYSEGSLDSQITDLLDKKFIESQNPNKKDPPYKITDEGKSFLNPLMFTTKIGTFISIWVAGWMVVYFLIFVSNPMLVMLSWFPLLLVSFIIFALILTFYPHILVRVGKKSF